MRHESERDYRVARGIVIAVALIMGFVFVVTN